LTASHPPPPPPPPPPLQLPASAFPASSAIATTPSSSPRPGSSSRQRARGGAALTALASDLKNPRAGRCVLGAQKPLPSPPFFLLEQHPRCSPLILYRPRSSTPLAVAECADYFGRALEGVLKKTELAPFFGASELGVAAKHRSSRGQVTRGECAVSRVAREAARLADISGPSVSERREYYGTLRHGGVR
jgi:hypothetical protein